MRGKAKKFPKDGLEKANAWKKTKICDDAKCTDFTKRSLNKLTLRHHHWHSRVIKFDAKAQKYVVPDKISRTEANSTQTNRVDGRYKVGEMYQFWPLNKWTPIGSTHQKELGNNCSVERASHWTESRKDRRTQKRKKEAKQVGKVAHLAARTKYQSSEKSNPWSGQGHSSVQRGHYPINGGGQEDEVKTEGSRC